MNEAMVMPAGYAVVDEEEMTYLDGGGIPVIAAKVAIYGTMMAFGIYNATVAYKALKGASGKYLAKKAVPALAKALGISLGSAIVSQVIGFICDVIDPIGWFLGKLDKMDGWSDGWIGGHGWFSWSALRLSNW